MIDDLDGVRRTLSAMGNHSHTTDRFQQDLRRCIESFAGHGDCLIEVGCYRGGMTAQFAWLGRRLGQHVHVVDIDPGYLEVARQSVEATSELGHVSFHLCDFAAFARDAGAGIRPSFALIDGDHRYDGVVADIRALQAMPTPPHGVAFHDYSLRYASEELADVRVDRALHDTLGEDVPHLPLGEVSRAGGPLRTAPRGADRHFHALGFSEGVLLEFRNLAA